MVAFPRNLFYHYYFLEIVLDNLELVFLLNKFIFICRFFTCWSFYILTLSTFLYFSTACKTQRMSLFSFYSLFRNHCILTLSTFYTFCITSGTKKRRLKALIWHPEHFIVKFNKSMYMSIFVCLYNCIRE